MYVCMHACMHIYVYVNMYVRLPIVVLYSESPAIRAYAYMCMKYEVGPLKPLKNIRK